MDTDTVSLDDKASGLGLVPKSLQLEYGARISSVFSLPNRPLFVMVVNMNYRYSLRLCSANEVLCRIELKCWGDAFACLTPDMYDF
jgi:hypothetical protein